MRKTESRKKDHVELVLEKNVQYSHSPGFERVKFVHNSLPELNYDEINLSTEFLGKKIKFPLLITGMTGGYKDAEKINRDLAKAAEGHKIALGIGSQRAMIEDSSLARTYNVRKYAPSIPILANIGGVQLTKYPLNKIRELVETIDADGLAVHLNPLQEMIQPEGDRDFKGVLNAIKKACEELGYPVIVKETGAGISAGVAMKLKHAGVSYIDVSGSGGTSWSKVEYYRGSNTQGFQEWGLTTLESLNMCKGIVPLIASGGIRNGIDAAKGIALGAEISGAAYPFLQAQKKGRTDKELEIWEEQLRIVCVLTGCKTHNELKHAKLIRYGP